MSESLMFREQLKENLYAPIGIDLGYGDYETAIAAFEDFMRLPAEIVEQSRISLDSRENATFGAFERRVGELNPEGRGLNQDNKNLFHYGPLVRQAMTYRLGKNLPADAKRFLSAAEEIYWAGVMSMKRCFEMLEESRNELYGIGGSGLVGIHFDEKVPMNHHLRFAGYFPRPGEVFATPHYDRSVGSIDMAKNKPGLWVSKSQDPKDKIYVPQGPINEGHFFLGGGWSELPRTFRYGHSDLSPTYHGVDIVWDENMQTETDPNPNEMMRWAIVMFGNPYELDTVPAPEKTRPYKAMGQAVFAGATA